MAKKKKYNNMLSNPAVWVALVVILTLVVGVSVFSQRTADIEDPLLDDSEAAPPFDVTISGMVWRQSPRRAHNVNLQFASTLLQGRVKEGHPENGCTNGADPGVHPNCDQNQTNESFDLRCNGQTIYSYRDRGPQFEEWTNVSRAINLPVGNHSCEVVWLNAGTGPGSVDYELTFITNSTSVGCQPVTITFDKIGTGIPADNMQISNQFASQYGITFANGPRSNGGACHSSVPLLARTGAPRTGFTGYGGGVAADNPAPGQTFGPWFLTDDGRVDLRTACSLVMTFPQNRRPSGAFSLDVLDIDGGERYQLRAYSGNRVLARQNITSGGNGRASRVRVSTSEPFDRVELVPTLAVKSTQWGMGVDNISFCAR